MRLLPVAAALLMLAGAAFGSPCLPGTLQDYILLGPDGCTVGKVTFQDFFLAELASFATEIDPALIQVTPGSLPAALFVFTLNTSAGPGEVLESSFHFTATGGLIGASIGLGNPLAAGDGAVTGILNVCAGGFFLGVEPIGCDGTPGAAIAFATDFDIERSGSVSFAPASPFDVFVDLTVDGGLGGFASLDTAQVAVITPEPSATALIGFGLLTLAVTEMRRKRRSR